MKRQIIFVLLLIFTISANGQKNSDKLNYGKKIIYEKVYLHIDRELYSPGDIIWFKTYLVSGISNKLLPGYKNIYVQLVDSDGKVVDDRIILSWDGISNGDFLIKKTIKDGQYTIRARTKYLKNFGEESYFHKKIWISRAKSSLALEHIPDKKIKDVEVSFFPESGNLIANTSNNIAFKAIDENGAGVQVSGDIIDENGDFVTSFKTSYLGMGKFILMPSEGKKYFALLNEFPDITYFLGQVKNDGINLTYNDLGNTVLFTLNRNFKINTDQILYLKGYHKGIELFKEKLIMSDFRHPVMVNKNIFPQGISKITVFDKDNNELAERLIFILEENENLIDISLNKHTYSTREKVEISITANQQKEDSITSYLSVAVVNNDYLSSSGNNLTIKSYLLLDSELKGSIESPASFFINTDSITSLEKLDLLMLINGWRNYYWEDIISHMPTKLTGWEDAGMTVNGYVKMLLKNKPVVNGKVIIGPFSSLFLREEVRTDSLGKFKFNRLYLRDSALVKIIAKNKRGRQNTEIMASLVLPTDTLIDPDLLKRVYEDIKIPMKFYRENYYRQMSSMKFNPEKNNILLDDIDIVRDKKVQQDDHFRPYSEPDKSVTVTEDDWIYANILEYLENRVAGVIVSGDDISIRGGRAPIFLMDGIQVPASMVANLVYNTPIQDVDKIEIIKTAGGLSFFGSQGMDGVIAIYTKHGDNKTEVVRYVKGQIYKRVRGFRKPLEFISTEYNDEKINNTKPDYRPTLLWEPYLSIKSGTAKIELFSSDNLSEYKIFVEGIGKNGKIYFGTKSFNITNIHGLQK